MVVTKEQQLAKNKQIRDKRKADRAKGITPIKRDRTKRKKQDQKGRKQQSHQEHVRRRGLKVQLNQLEVTKSSIESADTDSIIDEEEKAKKEDNNNYYFENQIQAKDFFNFLPGTNHKIPVNNITRIQISLHRIQIRFLPKMQ